MVTGCSCHDPIVFGHQRACEAGLGPRVAGGMGPYCRTASGDYQARYGPSAPSRPRNGGKGLPQSSIGRWLTEMEGR